MSSTLTDQQNDPGLNHRPTWAEIDLDALTSNFRAIRQQVDPNVAVMAVVKANAYGHGAVECANRLAGEGADWFGVALPEEGIELRKAGVAERILCLAGFWQGQTAACLQQNLAPAVYRLDLIESLDRTARDAGSMADVHIKIDTGMGRLGVRLDELSEFVSALRRFDHVRIDGLMTQLAAADDPSCEPLTRTQIQRFEAADALFRERGYQPTWRHLANSAGIVGHPESWGNMVRPGGLLYGLWRDTVPISGETGSGSSDRLARSFRPVMSLHSRIALLKWVPAGETLGYGCTFEASRKTLVATVPIGYHDGYMRGLSNRAKVIVRGVYAPVAGRVSMDLTLIDVTNVPGVALDDEVTLLGARQKPGREGRLEATPDHGAGPGSSSRDQGEVDPMSNIAVSAEDLANIAGTLSYEVTCGISERVPRVYAGAGR